MSNPEGATRMTEETEPLLKDIERILDDESAFIARPSKAVSVRIALAAYMAAQKKITETVKGVFARIEPTICDTHKMCDDGPVSSREGRISERDFDALAAMFTEAPLRSLAAVSAPTDSEVAKFVQRLRIVWADDVDTKAARRLSNEQRQGAADIIESLSASYSAACGERDEARARNDRAKAFLETVVAYKAGTLSDTRALLGAIVLASHALDQLNGKDAPTLGNSFDMAGEPTT